MAREISRAEAYERAHEVFSRINFNSFDYNSIKESLLDYVKLYFPEDFNDYIESSEFIAILEMFAYIGELLAYRVDMNAHENFITTAQRKESILRLARLISYTPTRNIPNRGLVKITSVNTTDTIFDSQSRNISGRTILWNDPNNTDWKEQFLLIMNRVMVQDFGTVAPEDRTQVDDVLLELYTLNNNPLASASSATFPFSVNVSGQTLPMELVPIQLTENGPQEKRPELNAKFTLMYGSDGLGDSSDTTGFLMFAKQGTLQRQQRFFDGITPNQTLDIAIENINDTDVFMNNVDPDTRQIISVDPFADALPHLTSTDVRYGEWVELDLSGGQNILFNTNGNRRKYEVETLDKDQIRLIFGDGEFSDIPNGSFDIWFRTSANQNISIPRNAASDVTASFSYNDPTGNVQTITFQFSLINSLQNGSASETIEHIRRVAPSVYYTQDRMVNGRDYNSFMLQDPSILRMRAVNRTFSGDSKYIAWHDPRENYEDVKLFGDDLALFWEEQDPLNGLETISIGASTASEIRLNTIQPLLSGSDFFAVIAPLYEAYGSGPTSIRRQFEGQEIIDLDTALTAALNGERPFVDLYYTVTKNGTSIDDVWSINPQIIPTTAIHMFRIEATFTSGSHSGWIVRNRTKRMVAQSQTTRFWNSIQSDVISNFDTLNAVTDRIVILQANTDSTGTSILTSNQTFGVLGQRLVSQNLPDGGLPDPNALFVLPEDINDDGISDGLIVEDLFGPYVDGLDAVIDQTFVYFKRESTTSAWIPQPYSIEIEALVSIDSARSDEERLYKRETGRYPMNFAWLHPTPNLNLIDPAATNIIDMYIITVAYYTELRRFLANRIDDEPTLPSSYDLRTSYAELLENKMISDTVIMHPGKFKILFGPRANTALQARFNVIRPERTTLTTNEVKIRIVEIIREFFDINYWEFGETFFFTELTATIHSQLGPEIDSIVLVPLLSGAQFGDLFQIQATENELFIPDINTSDIDIVDGFTPTNIRQ